MLFELARQVNIFVTEPRGQSAIDAAAALYDELTGVLGLLQHRDKTAVSDEAEALLTARQEARANKDFQRADALRDQLHALGFAVEDTPQGPKLKKL